METKTQMQLDEFLQSPKFFMELLNEKRINCPT